MGKKLNIISIMLLLLILIIGCQSSGGTTANTVGNKVGDFAPGFKLESLDGQIISLYQLRGKPILINFWTAWCSPCRGEMHYLEQIYQQWSAKGLVLLAVDLGESSITVREYVANNKLTLSVLLDVDRKVAHDYNISAIPTSFFINRNDLIQRKVTGAFQNVEAVENYLAEIMQ
jgi:peroxiredoxin